MRIRWILNWICKRDTRGYKRLICFILRSVFLWVERSCCCSFEIIEQERKKEARTKPLRNFFQFFILFFKETFTRRKKKTDFDVHCRTIEKRRRGERWTWNPKIESHFSWLEFFSRLCVVEFGVLWNILTFTSTLLKVHSAEDEAPWND